ncbi:hypothetical protein AKJ09_00072 [Labilithrix luteola]|uniref:DUF7768 domain-containing protein n=1 Tax=Labilithrix luteola TaxID=1391654 RepID=A0A0K1PIJ2_9BACT|nr:hypothetical protein [Labilithrix luteola]AKU93340.1 hypothetical protein AKJ09_00004 [Labilithrix luteola]AKU93408.1 hypothetical protein AKJ09_00072 [Labilithrix luteola]
MKLTVIESPYAGDIKKNIEYAKKCVLDCLRRGEAPYASHLFFTQDGLLDDTVPEQRKQGMEAGFAWGEKGAQRAVYIDRGLSSGMMAGIAEAVERGQKVVFRSIEGRDVAEYECLYRTANWTTCEVEHEEALFV